MIKTIEFKGEVYPAFQASGYASRFVIPFAMEVCKGVGYDIGCNRIEWKIPGAFPIDPNFKDKFLTWYEHEFTCVPEIKTLITSERKFFQHYKSYSAQHLPDGQVDYIFSSHCLEHLNKWVNVLNYWYEKIKPGGKIFLYLPDFSQKYWRGWHNTKHVNMFTPEIIKTYFTDQPEMWENVFCSGVDLNNSFTCIAQKK